MFVNKGNDFHLSNNSPCIGAGKADIYTPQDDIENSPRAVFPDTLIDLGAYENVLVVPENGLLLTDFSSDKSDGYPPLLVSFNNYTRSSNPGTTYEWDFNNDGIVDSREKSPNWIFSTPGLYTVKLKAINGLKTDSLVSKDMISVYKKGFIWVSTEGNNSGTGTFENPFASVQRAIKAANVTDTLILMPGIYNESINYIGKNITIGSRYLITNDSSFISSTRIRGKAGSSVVKFEKNENNNAKLIGLTIENGSGVQEGGGIFCMNASPVLKNLKIVNNSSLRFGGGICCRNNSSPVISDVIIAYNQSPSGSGIAFLNYDNVRLERSLIYKNKSERGGNALIFVGCKAAVINCTIADNTGSIAGICSEVSSLLILNSILWNNGNSEILFRDYDVDIVNSDLKGGRKGLTTEYADLKNVHLTNTINLDPHFAGSDYSLTMQSPCIDGGINFFVWKDEVVLNHSNQFYCGENPDMGYFEYKGVTSVSESVLPEEYNLSQNYPNPFNPKTRLSFALPMNSHIVFEVYNILGEKVTTLMNEVKNTGIYEINFDGSNFASGIYIYRFSAVSIESGERFEKSLKMILMK